METDLLQKDRDAGVKVDEFGITYGRWFQS